MNLPNKITVSRIISIPIILTCLLLEQTWADFVAGAFIGWSLISDVLDGIIARRMKIVTRLGANLDPIADALTFLTLFFCLYARDFIPLWLPMIFMYREMSMMGLRRFAALYGLTVSASSLGKLKTFTQSMAVSFGMIALLFYHGDMVPKTLPSNLFYYLTIAAAACSVFSFGHYFYQLVFVQAPKKINSDGEPLVPNEPKRA